VGTAIGGSLPLAIGVALSPIPIIVVVLLLGTPRARAAGIAYVLGWLGGLAAIGVVGLAIADAAAARTSASPATWVSWVTLALGLLLVGVGILQFHRRPRAGDEVRLPRWTSTVDRVGPAGAFGLAVVSSGANPKNVLLSFACADLIAGTGIAVRLQVIAYAIFLVLGSLGVGAPVAIYLALGDRSAKLLADLREWMSRHNAVIMSVLCVVIAAKLIGDAISSLAG
jgi:hypothetical protein